MASEEIAFLKDQVQRLSHELLKYQEQNIDLQENQNDALPAGSPAAPWLTDKSLLFPLMAEYDAQISSYENEIKSLRSEITRQIQENDRLSGQLKDTVDSQLRGADGGTGDLGQLQTEEQALGNLQMQVDIALQEKESAIERWHETEQEMDRLQQLLQEEKSSHQWGVIEQQAHQMQSEYFETVNLLNREIEQLQQDLRDVRQELENTKLQLTDSRKTNREMEQQLNWKDQEVADKIFKEGITDSKVGELKRIMDDLRAKSSSDEKTMEDLRREKTALEARIGEMQKRSHDVGSREMEAVSQMREAVQMIETAGLEKEQADVALQQKDEELEQLKEVINKLINEAGARTRQEVDAVRAQSNDRIKKLTEEVHALEMDNAEKGDTLEKAIREKRAAESELEKVYKEGVHQMNKELGSYELMNQRAIAAESSRDDANLQVDALQHKLKLEEMNCQQLKEQLEGQLTGERQRLSSLQLEFEAVNEERVAMQDEVADLKKRLQSASQEKEAAHRKYNKEITIFEQEHSMKLREYEVKLQSTEDVSRQSMTELRKLLSGQQRLCAKWKEECSSIAHKYEQKLTEVRAEMTHLKRRNTDVTKLLKDSQQKTIQAEKMIQEYTKNIYRMESRMKESEGRAADASKQLARHVLQEKRIESERRSLSQELRRSTMEASTKSVRSHPEELLVGDLAASHGSLNGSLRKKGDIDDFLQDR